MPTITILEPGATLTDLVSRTLPPALVRLVPSGEGTDLLVLAPTPGTRPPKPPVCRVLLTPERLGVGWTVPAAVSYGPSPRDTLTFSSLDGPGMVLSLQREVVTLDGRRVDRQEIPLPVRGDLLTTLAWAGTLLLAGVSPGDLPRLSGSLFHQGPDALGPAPGLLSVTEEEGAKAGVGHRLRSGQTDRRRLLLPPEETAQRP